MRIPGGQRITTRRSTAIICWAAVVAVTALLIRGRQSGLIAGSQWEPAAILLSAFVAFLSLFSWLLFFARRASADESPALFFSGLLTLVPPAVMAWHLMPPESALRGWMALGIVVFGIFAMLSPIPVELFRIPRDRRSYANLLTDSTLSRLDTEPPQPEFHRLAARTVFRLTGAGGGDLEAAGVGSAGTAADSNRDAGPPGDPWGDPFEGTGRRLSQVSPVHSADSGKVPLPKSLRQRFPESPSGANEDTLQSSVSSAQASPAPARSPELRESAEVPTPPHRDTQTPIPAGDLRELDRMLRRSFEESVEDVDDEEADAASEETAECEFVEQHLAPVSMERELDSFGGERVTGRAIAVFAAGQKRAHIHIPFAPPLPGIPDVECEPTGSEMLRAKAGLRQPYGIRIEVRRAVAAAALRAEISFEATAMPRRPMGSA